MSLRKYCFVCNKEGCWLSKHSKEERDELRRKFKERFSQHFDKRTRQYIADYEETDYDNEFNLELIDGAMEALTIDIESLPASPGQE